MKESFLYTTYIETVLLCFKYTLHPSEPIYTITVTNAPGIRPFVMAMTSDTTWKIISKVDGRLMAAEPLLALAILQHNSIFSYENMPIQ